MPRTLTFVLVAVTSLLGLSLAASAQQTIRVGWTIPAEESKYWMMRRPAEFPELGKTYKVEWVQFQGTGPMAQAMVAGALDCSTQGVLTMAQAAVQANLEAYSSPSMWANVREASRSTGRSRKTRPSAP